MFFSLNFFFNYNNFHFHQPLFVQGVYHNFNFYASAIGAFVNFMAGQ